MTSAVLMLVFRRPETTQKVFGAIRQARPPRLYVAADGPRDGRPGEPEACAATRKIFEGVDWPCKVETLFRPSNLGLKRAIPEAITWFFSREPEGIILEDDCYPSQDFFRYADELLARYRADERVMQISGSCLVKSGTKHSYYFSKYAHIWGWAGWARAWRHYDVAMKAWPDFKARAAQNNFWQSKKERRYWERIFDAVHQGEVNTWDYQWLFALWNAGGLTVYPNGNMVSNIGFGVASTNTHEVDKDKAARPWEPLGEIQHPARVERAVEADAVTFRKNFYGSVFSRWKARIVKLLRILGIGR